MWLGYDYPNTHWGDLASVSNTIARSFLFIWIDWSTGFQHSEKQPLLYSSDARILHQVGCILGRFRWAPSIANCQTDRGRKRQWHRSHIATHSPHASSSNTLQIRCLQANNFKLHLNFYKGDYVQTSWDRRRWQQTWTIDGDLNAFQCISNNLGSGSLTHYLLMARMFP